MPTGERKGKERKYDVLKVVSTRAYTPAIQRLVERMLELRELEKDDAWFDEQPPLTTLYLRYDGCAPDGSDPDNAVGDEHAARKA